jgi:DNA helicase HerA-like ATPase
MAEELGTVISTLETPTTGQFSFVIKSSKVRKGQFVQAQAEDGIMLGAITEITRANRYFERAESVAEYERSSPIAEHFPTSDWEYTVALVKVHGTFRGAGIVRNTFPIAPGVKIYEADLQLLKDFLGFTDDGLDVGSLENHNLTAKLSIDGLLQKHLAILAMSGSGKSYFTSVLLEELLSRKKETGRIAMVVIDNHGEYAGFRQSEFAQATRVFEGKKMRIALAKVSPQMLSEWMPNMSGVQARELGKILKDLKKEMKEKQEAFGLSELEARINAQIAKENVRAPMLSWIAELHGLGLIAKADCPKLADAIAPGRLAVFDLSDIDSLKKKQVIVSYFARKLFKQRKKGKIPPFVLIVEEAHNFAREKAERGSAISKNVIETIAREGRKFGASLCLISQRPVQLSTTALSQCNTNIILRVTNPYDIKHIGESCEGIDSYMLNSITTLRVGEALIVGEAVGCPVFIKVRKKRSRVQTRSTSLALLAKRFEEGTEKKKSDVEAFL